MDIPNTFKNRTGAIQLSDLDDNFNAVKVAVNTADTQIAVLQSGQASLVQSIANFSAIPIGCIVMWSGSIATVPAGWRLCDGTNGTPDLRNRFIIGASQDTNNESRTSLTGTSTKTGGSKDSVVVNHGHTSTVTSSMGSDTNTLDAYIYASDSGLYAAAGDVYNAGSNGSTFSDNFYTSQNNENRQVRIYKSHTHSHTLNVDVSVDDTGVTGTNLNLPPYFALAYIMKI